MVCSGKTAAVGGPGLAPTANWMSAKPRSTLVPNAIKLRFTEDHPSTALVRTTDDSTRVPSNAVTIRSVPTGTSTIPPTRSRPSSSVRPPRSGRPAVVAIRTSAFGNESTVGIEEVGTRPVWFDVTVNRSPPRGASSGASIRLRTVISIVGCFAAGSNWDSITGRARPRWVDQHAGGGTTERTIDSRNRSPGFAGQFDCRSEHSRSGSIGPRGGDV